MDDHIAATADIAGARIGDCERKAGRDGGVHGVASGFENVGADARGARFLRHHHAMWRNDRRHGPRCRRWRIVNDRRRVLGARKT